ncbi:MAG: ATP-dependent helicase HrpB [Paracoccaceae bacterium]
MTELPIDALLPQLCATIAAQGQAVLQAPPGAGKTTRVPLALLDTVRGKIVMLEPRRLAARAAAERMAETLGEKIGQTVGYRIRGESKPGRRIEVVTEGILTRMLQSDPSLDGVGAVIFDEFHERSLNADLGLAMVLETRAALRDDLALIVMSATLDAAPVAALMNDAPLLTAEGRAFPVETRWLDTPLPRDARLPEAVADLVLRALDETQGGALVFLPGEGEIRRTAARLRGRLPDDAHLHTLFGAMDFAAQRAAIAPASHGRKVVLATSIAETSLTIQDVRVVVDAGLARRARFDPNSGMSRLVTERASLAEAEQRRGRAGRVAPGICYRLWTKGQEGALPAFAPPEIETADLTGLALELALWGGADLPFLTQPPPGPMAEARALLHDLGALAQGRITAHGKAMAALPLHPRLAHMLLSAGQSAAPLVALLADRDPLQGAPADLSLRLRALAGERVAATPNREAIARINAEARRLARLAPADAGFDVAEMAALAYPDRIGQRRKGEAPRYLLSGGKGASFDPADPLAQAPLIVATDLDGDPREARIRQALPLSDTSLRALFKDRIVWVETCAWSPRDNRIVSQRREMLGALALAERPWDAPPEARARAALEGVRALGLGQCGMTAGARRLQSRVELLRAQGADLPDFTDTGLMSRADDWLLPHLGRIRNADDLRALDLAEALRNSLTWDQMQTLDQLAPAHFTTPLGRKVPIDYDHGQPAIALRLQEMFGTTVHPTIGPRRLPLKVTLLSPAQRPVQTTTDIPAFWDSSYADVRKDMRGQYPRHPWPENPREADPTLRAKPRGT